MVKIADILNALEAFAPFDTAADYDNTGLLLGEKETEVSACVVTLDVTDAAISAAQNAGAQLIIAHHPVIFHPVKQLSPKDRVWQLIQAGIAVIGAHTNLDAAPGGVADVLAETLGLAQIKPLPGSDGAGRIGEIAPCTPEAFASRVKAALGCSRLRFVPGRGPVARVAAAPGAGGFCLAAAVKAGADALVTGDVKHDQMIEAACAGITLADAGHFETEQLICRPLADRLRAQFAGVTFLVPPQTAPYLWV